MRHWGCMINEHVYGNLRWMFNNNNNKSNLHKIQQVIYFDLILSRVKAKSQVTTQLAFSLRSIKDYSNKNWSQAFKFQVIYWKKFLKVAVI